MSLLQRNLKIQKHKRDKNLNYQKIFIIQWLCILFPWKIQKIVEEENTIQKLIDYHSFFIFAFKNNVIGIIF